ncbi:hypothetical protein P4N68_07200 [Corynebacterium felinum]|uniref:Uncharacterized protein n=1 Tax=Corynebacterium felinum TaxID=131318 RepID=A0ABU2B5F8_9CORY|nr:hypothetical protein [Corynebacterium felinum]MDF5820867.1 hypothetical protein [Corynebacterium felinum]MDR7353631.1 hypothetical protein [Corynebacterium felinum]WJY95810.1 hypothetical protein CFELI_11070 [Corynebacterium felinum]
MTTQQFLITSGERGLRALAQRVNVLDSNALARLRTVSGGVDVFFSTPFGVLASRRVTGTVSVEGLVVKASELFDAPLTPLSPAAWQQGALPPKEGFVLVDEVPADVVYRLNIQGKELAQQFSGPLGPPQSLLNQKVLTVEGNGERAEVPMRVIFCLSSLGLIPRFDAAIEVPRHIRVSKVGRWVRVDAPFGSVYFSEELNVLSFI